MNPLNKKKQWGVIIGKPNMGHSYWGSRAPSKAETTEIWHGQRATDYGDLSGDPILFWTKGESEECMMTLLKNEEWTRKYHLRVQKFHPHKPEP